MIFVEHPLDPQVIAARSMRDVAAGRSRDVRPKYFHDSGPPERVQSKSANARSNDRHRDEHLHHRVIIIAMMARWLSRERPHPPSHLLHRDEAATGEDAQRGAISRSSLRAFSS